MSNSRLIELLNRAADAMEDGQDPFDLSFLSDHDVAAYECITMADLLALGARLVAFGLDNPKIALGAINGARMAAAYQALTDALDKWKPLVEQVGGDTRA